MKRVVAIIMLAGLFIGAGAARNGSLLRPAIVDHLANRPEVANRFEDPNHGRFDATVFLFTCALGVPFVVIGFGMAVALAHFALEVTVLPLGRRMGLPDGMVVAGTMLVVAIVAYMQADLWVPRSIHVLALLSRAWVISTT